jgi:threonine dehydrogenase-like Zn-dependent dehydrogenase
MTMLQLTFVKPGNFEWRDVPAPKIENARQAIVRPLAVARCDLDFYIATGFAPYPGPFAFGHEAVAEVVEVGDSANVKPGDRVVVPFQISCGTCTPCRRGFTNSCSSVPMRSAYGLKPTCGHEWGGALSDLMLIPFADHMLVKAPANLDPISIASAADNIPDGWRAVAGPLKQFPGANVLIVGGAAQSVGLYAAGSAVALKAGRVLYLDDDPGRRKAAAAMGATAEPLNLGERTAKPKGAATGSPLAKLSSASEQFEVTVDASGDPAALNFAVASTAPNGICTSVAIYFSETTPMPLLRMYGKGITFHTGRVQARPPLPDVLHACAAGHFHPEHVTARVVPFAEAADAMTDPAAKIVFAP